MNIWIVEDENPAAEKAFEAVKRLRPGDEIEVFRNHTILWSVDIERMPPVQGEPSVRRHDHMPDIVVLDLFAEGQFRAADFYAYLRSEEAGHREAAYIIVWSVKTGFPSVNEFVTRRPLVDRRLTFTNSKSGAALEAALDRALKSWLEARYL
jgi:hypothetical protein